MTQVNDAPTIMKHRPFQLALVWETLCIFVGVLAMVSTGDLRLLIGAVILGGAPLIFILVRFTQQNGPRSKDIVQ